MKIIYIIKSMASLAGTERIVSNKMNYLAEQGYDITLITYEQGEHPLCYKLNEHIKVFDIDIRFFTLYKYGTIKKIIQYIRFRNLFEKRLEIIVKKLAPDIICCTTYSIKLIDKISMIAKNNGAKSILESHVAMYSLLNYYDNPKKNLKFYLNMMAMKHKFLCVRQFDKLVVLTHGDAEVWNKYKSPIIIPNFVNQIKDAESNIRITKHRIISVGRLNEEKGFDLMIKAFSFIQAKHKDWILDIYGSGFYKNELTVIIQKTGLSNFVQINEATSSIYNEYMNSDFLVLSSRYEGFGLVLAEAMSCGIPCIAFDCDYGPREIIHDGEDGLLVRNGDVEDLAKKINWMITHERERKEMGLRAHESAKRYAIEPIMQQWMKLFNEITSK